jgi:putative ABC transport system permease protein
MLNLSDDINQILDSLKKHKLRTFLTSFGVFWGVFMLIIMLATGDGLENGVFNSFKGYALNSFHIYTKSTKIPFNGFQSERKIDLTNFDLKLIKEKFKSDIKYISPRSFMSNFQNVKYNGEKESYAIYGLTKDALNIRNVKMISGRYINLKDETNSRNIAVIGAQVLKDFFLNKDPIKRHIEIQGEYYKIVGVFESLKEGEAANNENLSIYLPHSTFQRGFNRNETISSISISPNRDKKIENKVISFLKNTHNISPKDKAIYTYSTQKQVSKFNGLFKGIRIFMWIVGLGTLLSGIIGISNIMIITVKERKKEIGIRKAIGAKPSSIINLIVFEGVFLTFVSGYLGLSFGLIFVEFVNFMMDKFNIKNEFFLNPKIDLSIILSSILILILFGFIASFIPARKAALIKPIEALREE